MPRLLVFQHVAHEILGTLDPVLRGSGFRIKYVNFERHPNFDPSLEGYDGLIVLGGPMNVDEVKRFPYLEREVHSIREALRARMPILGICLGSQLIAKALGAKVYKNQEKEIGWYDVRTSAKGKKDPLTSHFSSMERIFQWHGDTFDVPEGAELLASSPLCKNQAFRYRIPANKKEMRELKGKIDPDRIRQETPTYVPRLKELSDKAFAEFIGLFGFTKKRTTLPSK